tara:strand:+ start:60 stop:860 length:801 start_codon:yes stop_codon:yes gene_type:complete
MARPNHPEISPPLEGEKRYRLTISYDGTLFHGFAKNPDVDTVEGLLNEALQKLLGTAPSLTCAGRTDAGVHAKGQIVSFDSIPFEMTKIQKALNTLCSPYVVITAIEEAGGDFSARFSAKNRTYRYQVLNQAHPDPFLSRYSWHVRAPISIERMNSAGQELVGEHDFSSFCRKNIVVINGEKVHASLTREVTSLRWDVSEDNLLELWITANAFCHQMVRSITGTLVDIGIGKLDETSIEKILKGRHRNLAGQVAPPHGLTLWNVGY